jgi:DNA-binding response OmpR family regulator
MAEGSVLVVDDDADILGIVREVLLLEGFRVQTASNGAEALVRVGTEQPDLVLLDMRMPVMDGWQFASHLRSRYDHLVPVLVMTAAKDARARAREIEAEGFIAKPFDIDDLVDKVREHIRAGGLGPLGIPI